MKTIQVMPATPIGSYKMAVTLSDDNIDDPKSSTVTFKILIKEEKVVFVEYVPDVVKKRIKETSEEEFKDDKN